jgi:TolB-like protein/Tfp pilus assembly protein PilF
MFTDMVGYTALGQRNESLALALVDEQRKLIRPILSRHNGTEINAMGDAFLVEFPSALDAVKCAYDIQRAAREFNISLSTETRVHLRIGVHLGDVVESSGDISGDAVNVASRIEPLADDGGVCLTRQVYDHVQNKFELPLRSVGTRTLKNMSVPIEVYKMMMPWEQERPAESGHLDRKRIAVLPFANMSPDPNDAYFADGMMEELITTLSKVGELTLVARTSVMQYRNSAKRISTIAQELNTGTLIEGSVRKATNKVRITVQLLDGVTENHVWAENYDRDLNDVFEIQSDVAKRVSEVLKVQLLPSEERQIEKRPTLSREAHILYLKGRYYWNERTPQSIKTAVEYFEKAMEQDPSFALAYAGLADCYVILSDQEVVKPIEAAEKTKSFAEKALGLDPSLAEAHAALASVFVFHFWEWRRAEFEFKRSIELNPKYPTARQWYGKYLSFTGRFDEALEQHRKALELDPLSLIININFAEALVEARRYSEGIEQAQKTLALNPAFAIGHYETGQFYVSGSEFEKAIREFDTVLELIPRFPQAIGSLGHAYGLMGRPEEAAKKLEELEKLSRERYVSPTAFAMVEYAMGKKAEAFKHLDQAFEERSGWLLYFKVFPGFDDIRADGRFTRLLKRMGFTDTEIEVQSTKKHEPGRKE